MTQADVPTEIRDGRYQLLELLGVGGMATVHRARDRDLQVDRAIKMLRPGDADRASFKRRLRAEAHAMARVQHPHILTIHDVGTEGEFFYVVMPLAPGGSLADRLEKDGALPVGEAVRLTLEVLSGLSAAHANGVVHRDVKPQNVLIDARGHGLLADFGIALDSNGQSDRRTRSGVAMGSPSYMPPEQRVDARSVDRRADIYAVGAMLYELLSNDNPADLYTAEPDSHRWASVPESLVPVLRKATAMQRGDRYSSAEDFSEALLAVASTSSWAERLESRTNHSSRFSNGMTSANNSQTFGFGDEADADGTAGWTGGGSPGVVLASLLSGGLVFVVGGVALIAAVGVIVLGPLGAGGSDGVAGVQVDSPVDSVAAPVEVDSPPAQVHEEPGDGVDDVAPSASPGEDGSSERPDAAGGAGTADSPDGVAEGRDPPPVAVTKPPPVRTVAGTNPAGTTLGGPEDKVPVKTPPVSSTPGGTGATANSGAGASGTPAVSASARAVPLGDWQQAGAGGGLRLTLSGDASSLKAYTMDPAEGRKSKQVLTARWDAAAGSVELSDGADTEGGGNWHLSPSDDGSRLSGTFRSFEGKTRLVSFRAAP